jgi:predicted transcriptional regulator
MPATAKTPEQTSKRYIVPILERALIILEALAKAPRGMGISQLARELGMPKNSVFRILTTLYSSGYLQRDDEGRIYSLSRKILALGYEALDELSLVDKSLDVMRELRDETGETVLRGEFRDARGLLPGSMVLPNPALRGGIFLPLRQGCERAVGGIHGNRTRTGRVDAEPNNRRRREGLVFLRGDGQGALHAKLKPHEIIRGMLPREVVVLGGNEHPIFS